MQEKTDKVLTPDSELKDGKVRPGSKVKITFLDSRFHPVPYYQEEVHPALAKKLVDEGKAEYSQGKSLTAEQKQANKDFLAEKLASRKKTRKGALVTDDDLLDEDTTGADKNTGAGKGGSKNK